MTRSQFAHRIKDYPRIALVLQGGGALGSYQAGVYEGLANVGIHPNWVAGISIGALNCAIIAGNAPEKRVERLHEFWNAICCPAVLPSIFGSGAQSNDALNANPWAGLFEPVQNFSNPFAPWCEGMAQTMFGSMAAMSALVQGQPSFFSPRMMAPGGGSPDQTSFYDTAPMIETLERFADFDRINSGEVRVSLGATNVASGNFVYFDSEQIRLTPKHFLASGSLPPGFPATEIDGEYYWDGGCVSNTPLEYVLGQTPRRDTLVFQVDLWSAQGALPTDIFQVNERLKDIQYSSRTRSVTNTVHMAQLMRQVLIDTVARIPQSIRDNDPWFDEMVRHTMGARFNVIHLIYRNKSSEGHYKDYQFSSETMRMHWQTGQHDMHETLLRPECLDMPAAGENFVTFDIHTHKRISSQSNNDDQYANATLLGQVPQTAAPTEGRRRAAKKTAAVKAAKTVRAVKASNNRKPPHQDPT